MISHLSYEQVIEGLGDKAILGLLKAVEDTRHDYHEYRTGHSLWVVGHGEVGLALWLHDRLWDNCRKAFDDVEGVSLDDRENGRQIWVGSKYVLRAKRHHRDGSISATERTGTESFWTQNSSALPELREVRLAFGYVWRPKTREVGDTVISMRDGIDNPLWYSRLEAEGENQFSGEVMQFPTGTTTEPIAPVIEFEAGGEQVSGQEEV
ncbi:hypothetical protein [Glycomyces tarimensis]